MRSTVRSFIQNCDTCQRHKSQTLSPAGLLHPLPIPTQIWADISMDFVDGLPPSKGKTVIFVVVDRLSKYAHFMPLAHPCTAITVAQVFFENVFKLHGMPESIVCDCDPTFTGVFWTTLFKLQGTDFNLSSAYHPQTDGQTEIVNRTLEMYLRCITSDRPKEWTTWLPWIEYIYNTSSHSATKSTPFEVIYGQTPPSLLTYIPGTTNLEAVDQALQARDEMLRVLRHRLQLSQNRMKQFMI